MVEDDDTPMVLLYIVHITVNHESFCDSRGANETRLDLGSYLTCSFLARTLSWSSASSIFAVRLTGCVKSLLLRVLIT